MPSGRLPIEETGHVYGMLTVLRKACPAKDRDTRWVCQCECGNTTVIRGSSLRNGRREDCGCRHQLQHSLATRDCSSSRKMSTADHLLAYIRSNPGCTVIQAYKEHGSTGTVRAWYWALARLVRANLVEQVAKNEGKKVTSHGILLFPVAQEDDDRKTIGRIATEETPQGRVVRFMDDWKPTPTGRTQNALKGFSAISTL